MPDNTNKQAQAAAHGQPPAGRFAYAAAATPPGVSGIAVVRMSGRSAIEIADEVFVAEYPSGRTVSAMDGYTCAYGRMIDPHSGETIDQSVITKFVAPHSYTGEDTVEISCHGGTAVKEEILRVLYATGARPADPGEFTRTAFLNGKLDLAQAEAVMDLISSTARKAGAEAVKQLQGRLSSRLDGLAARLYQTLSSVELILEFPEHEETPEATGMLLSGIGQVRADVDSLIRSFGKGRILREGFKVVIAGKPNAGKSSMMNTLSGYDRAIVTDTPGTTRDTIEEPVDIDGLPVRLVDTAGLRSAEDKIEQMGIDRAKTAIKDADLVLWVFDEEAEDPGRFAETDEDFQYIMSEKRDYEIAFIVSKSDIKPSDKGLQALKAYFPAIPVFSFSAVTEEGLEDVRQLIIGIYEKHGSASSDEVIITNGRHVHSLGKARSSLDMAIDGLSAGLPLDIIAGALRGAAESLAEITGDEVSDRIVSEIFSRFCIGK
ncbi:MAG: tRNA uridine-5-carboxymethylaminomethyl(34) synthesis GTPase MnmE [Saccharofermentanales bacterium]